MSWPVAAVAARTAAGDLDGLWNAVHGDRDLYAPTPPYAWQGLSNPAVAAVGGLDRDVPAEALLADVVGAALARADLPQGSTVGLVVGTSSGNICGPWERWHRATIEGRPADEAGCGRDTPTQRVAARFGLAPHATLSAVCVSGAAALSIAEGWLAEGLCDAVVAAGVDALSLYVHAGFSGLGALSATRPRPFHPDRDGLLLGEGAAAIVVCRTHARPIAWLRGTALASDARHMTAPDPEAGGAVAALRGAIHAAGLDASSVHAVSVHGTGTRFNDGTEAIALERVFGRRPLAVHGIKHRIGHTMGASGAIEVAVMADAIRRGALPPPLRPPPGAADDPAPAVAGYAEGAPSRARVAVTLSAAFGGLDAAVVLADEPGSGRVRFTAVPGPAVEVDLAQADPDALPRSGRLDPYTRVGLLALDRLRAQAAIPADVALVLASRAGCRVVDLAYHERLVREGAAQVSRLAFTYTLPGAPLAEASIRFGWRGPQLPFVGDPALAEAEALRQIRVHGVSAAIALEVDAPDPHGPAHARASLWRRSPA